MEKSVSAQSHNYATCAIKRLLKSMIASRRVERVASSESVSLKDLFIR